MLLHYAPLELASVASSPAPACEERLRLFVPRRVLDLLAAAAGAAADEVPPRRGWFDLRADWPLAPFCAARSDLTMSTSSRSVSISGASRSHLALISGCLVSERL